MDKYRILVVEDEHIIALDLQDRLAHMGYRVVGPASCASEALRLAGETRPDLVLMDIVLKGSPDGIQTAQAISQQFDLPVIYLTAHSDSAVFQRAQDSGPSGYILKPFQDREMSMAIEMALLKHRTERQLRENGQWLRAILHSIGDAVIVADARHIVQFMNPAAETLTGWNNAQASGTCLADLLIEYAPDEQRATLSTYDGRRILAEYTDTPFCNERGEAMGRVLVLRDRGEQQKVQAQIRENAARAEALARAASRLNAQLDLQTVINVVCQESAQATQASYVAVLLYNEIDETFCLSGSYGISPEHARAIRPLPRALYDRVTGEQGQIVVIPDLESFVEREQLPIPQAEYDASAIVSSMMREGKLEGVLCIILQPAREFSPGELLGVEALASQATMAIANAHLYQITQRELADRREAQSMLREQVATLQMFISLSQELTGAGDPQAVLDIACRRAAEVVHAPKAIAGVAQLSGQIEIAAQYGLSTLGEIRQPRPLLPPQYAERPTVQGVIAKNKFDTGKLNEPNLIVQEGVQAYLRAPLFAGGKFLGLLLVFDVVPRVWSVEEIQILSLLSNQTAASLASAEQYNTATNRAHHLATLNEIGQAISSTLEVESMLHTLLDRVCHATQATAGSVAFVDRETGELVFRHTVGLHTGNIAGLRLKLGQGVAGWVAQHKQALLVTGAVPHLPPEASIDLAAGIETDNIVCAPLVVRDRVTGIIELLNKQSGPFSTEDMSLLESVGTQAAIAIENARLFEIERAGRQRLETLYRIGQTINSTLDADAILERLVNEAMRATDARLGAVLIAQPEQGIFEHRAMRGYTREMVARIHAVPLSLEAGLNGQAYRARRVICVDDVRTDPAYHKCFLDIRSELVVPIIRGGAAARGGQVLGNLDLQSPQVGAFRKIDLSFLQALVNQVAIALENARLFRETRRQIEGLSAASDVALAGASGIPFDEAVTQAILALNRLWPDGNVSILFLDDKSQTLRLHPASRGIWLESIATSSLPIDQSIAGWACRNRQAIRVGDVLSDPRYIDLGGSRDVQSEMCAPLLLGERATGVISVVSPLPNAFNDHDTQLLKALAGQLAIILEKARLDAALSRHAESLEQRVRERTAELSTANAELARAARLKDEFLANMSHELRTPLNAILGLSEALLEQVFGSLTEKQAKSLRTIDASGRHLLALINDILDLSKIEAGKLEINIGSVVVEMVCQACLQLVRQSAQEKGLRISSQFDSRVTTIQADERRLKQILVNLLSNAVKFTPPGGEIGLAATGDPDQHVVRFAVWDTGIGISESDLAQLFRPFVQLDSSLSRQYAGTGLGLSLVYRMVEMHNGSVSVESQVGQGSRFIVSLPWQESEHQEPAALLAGKQQGPDLPHPPGLLGEPATILLAEDNEANISTMIEYLEIKGYRVMVARDGREAVNLAVEKRPDAILMDIQMPGMNGLEALRNIRADGALAHVPIIALTGLAMPGDKEKCLAAGANEYLSKPVSLRQLLETIRAQLKRIPA